MRSEPKTAASLRIAASLSGHNGSSQRHGAQDSRLKAHQRGPKTHAVGERKEKFSSLETKQRSEESGLL